MKEKPYVTVVDMPYIIKERTVVDRFYNPNYGDNRVCRCSHTYYQHFDIHNNMDPRGCKYCHCYTFVEGELSKSVDVKGDPIKTVDRTHEECADCALEMIEPPQCQGHCEGPVGCSLFKSK